MNKITRGFPVALSLAAIASFNPLPSSAQGGFVRNDTFEFREQHVVQYEGTANALTVTIDPPFDWRTFTLAINTNNARLVYTPSLSQLLPGPLDLTQVRIDWTGSGTAWGPWLPGGSITDTHTFPEPANGVSEDHVIAIEFGFDGYVWDSINQSSVHVSPSVVSHATVTVLPQLRVYADAEGNAIVQFRNEECAPRTPLLLVEGIDPINTQSAETYYALTQGLLTTLHDQGYEVFFLNFHDAARDLRANVPIVQNALDMLHALNQDTQIALVGMSMGGVICRYALAQREQNSADHHVGLFISFDAPQQSAHANQALQDYIRLQNPNEPAIALLQHSLQTAAAKQLLDYNTYDTVGQTEHDKLYNELNGINGNGYPHKCRNVAISNGALVAAYGNGYGNRFLLTLQVILGDQSPLLHDIPAEQRDEGAGSIQVEFATTQYGTLFSKHISILGLFHYDVNLGYKLTVAFDPVYMPTTSTLDLYQVKRDDDGNITGDEVAGMPVRSHGFDEFYYQPITLADPRPRGLPHNALSDGTKGKVLEWLNRTARLTVNYQLSDGGQASPLVDDVSILRGKLMSIQPTVITTSDGRQVTYVFDHWDDGSVENPRRLFTARDVARTVSMKAHLATSASGAAWASGRRRIKEAADPLGPTTHAVYESAGNIWYLRNRRSAGWEQERRLSFGNAYQPAITTQSFGGGDLIQVYVAWLDNGGGVWFRNSSSPLDNGLSWDAPVGPHSAAYGSFSPKDVTLADPKCSGCGQGPCACWPALLWADWEADWLPWGGVFYLKQPQLQSSYAWVVPGAEGDVSTPVATSGDCGASSFFHADFELAFIRDGKVYVERFRDPNINDLNAQPVLCLAPVNLTTTGWTATNPTIVSNGTDVLLAWEEASGNARRIPFRQRTGATWSSPVYFNHLDHVPAKPVLGINQACGKVNLIWDCSGHTSLVSRPLAGSTWAPVADIGQGRAPTVVSSTTSAPSLMWTSGSVAPYSVNLSNSAIAPGATWDLSPDVTSESSIWLTWTAPGAGTGTTADYDIRYSQTQITDATWNMAMSVPGPPTPGAPGSPQGCEVGPLMPCTLYWFAMKSRDACGNWSPISNACVGQTVCWGGGGGGASAKPATPIAAASPVKGMPGGSAGDPAGPANAAGASAAAPDGGALVIEMQTEGDSVVWRAYSIDSLAVPAAVGSDSTGIYFQAREPSGWTSWARYVPSASSAHFGVRSLWNQGRAVFVGPYALDDTWSSPTAASRTGPSPTNESNLIRALADTLAIPFSRGSDAERAQGWYVLVNSLRAGVSSPASDGLRPLPSGFALRQNHPNPFHGVTTIRFELPVAASVRLEVFDAQGRRVRMLLNRSFDPGFQSVEWDQRDDSGRQLGPGVYLYRIQAGSFHDRKRMVLLP